MQISEINKKKLIKASKFINKTKNIFYFADSLGSLSPRILKLLQKQLETL